MIIFLCLLRGIERTNNDYFFPLEPDFDGGGVWTVLGISLSSRLGGGGVFVVDGMSFVVNFSMFLSIIVIFIVRQLLENPV